MGQTTTAMPHSLVSPEVIAAMCKRALATPPGCFLEVGVYHGGSAWHLARAAESQGRQIYLYDTFTGIPYRREIDSHQVGDFGDASFEFVQEVIPYATIVAGIFPAFALPMGPIAFAHLDCDQHQSYEDALNYLEPRMVPGGVVWCDDVDCLSGATAAVREFAARTGRLMVGAEKVFLQF